MTIRSGSKFVFICLLAVLLPSSLAFAADATVDCSGATPGAFTTHYRSPGIAARRWTKQHLSHRYLP